MFTDALKLTALVELVLTCSPLTQLFLVSSANEWKTIDVRNTFTESDEEVLVKCSTWTADGKRIICAARNAVLVSILESEHMVYTYFSGDAGCCLL